MPANTPNGLPYPLTTEPVADGADAIHALALALDSLAGMHIQAGATYGGRLDQGPQPLNFPGGPFPGPPAVYLTPVGNANVYLASAPTAEGFAWYNYPPGGGIVNVTVYWLAVWIAPGMTAAELPPGLHEVG